MISSCVCVGMDAGARAGRRYIVTYSRVGACNCTLEYIYLASAVCGGVP